MNTDLIKYITFFSLFIVCININGRIMLDENDKLVSPLPKPVSYTHLRAHET